MLVVYIIGFMQPTGLLVVVVVAVVVIVIPCNGKMCPTVIDKSRPIGFVLSRLRDGKYAYFRFGFLVFCARSNSRRTLPLQGIVVIIRMETVYHEIVS